MNNYQGTTTIAGGSIRLAAAVGAAGFHSTIGDGNSPVTLSGGSIEYSGAPAATGGPRVLTLNNPITMTAGGGIGHTTGSGAGGFTLTPAGNRNIDIMVNNFTATGGTLTLYNNGSSNEPNIGDPYSGLLDVRVGFTAAGFDFDQPVVVQNHTNVLVSANRKTYLMSSNTSGSHEFSGVISGNGGYVRNGAGGTSVLSAVNTYTGDTQVLAGTLSLPNANALSDLSDVFFFTGGGVLNLPNNITETIDQLFVDGVAQAPGTYDSGNLGAFITGLGELLVSSGGGSGGAVPEPGTFALAVMMIFGLAASHRRRG